MLHKVAKKQHNSKLCFVCGLKNRSGLQASFFESETGELIAIFRPGPEHQSYPGRLHGGIASTILDETIGRAILIGSEHEIWGVTLELNVEFKKPIPLETEIRVIGRITEENSRLFWGTGEIVLPDGSIAAAAKGKYLKVPLDKIADFDAAENEWRVTAREDDPEQIEI